METVSFYITKFAKKKLDEHDGYAKIGLRTRTNLDVEGRLKFKKAMRVGIARGIGRRFGEPVLGSLVLGMVGRDLSMV